MPRRNRNAQPKKKWPPEPMQKDARMSPGKGSGKDKRVAEMEKPFGGRK